MTWTKVEESEHKTKTKTVKSEPAKAVIPEPTAEPIPEPELGSEPLKNVRQESFCQRIVNGIPQQDAYVEAGYKCKSTNAAGAAATRMLSNVKIADRIIYLQKQIAAAVCSDAVATKQELAESLTRIIRTTMSDFMSYDKDGEAFFDLKPETIGKDAIKKMRCRTTRNEAGQVVFEKQIEDIELVDRLAAIEKLAKLMGYDVDAEGSLPADLKDFMARIAKDIFTLPSQQEDNKDG